MKFCTAINCMDGRVQLPVIEYLKKRFQGDCVDVITEPGPVLILSKKSPGYLVDSIIQRIKISVECHGSVGIGIAGHYDCAGNPASKEMQVHQIRDAIALVQYQFNKIDIIGLWVDESWKVEEFKY